MLLLDHDSIRLKQGDSLWIRGPNGIGKTTFLERAIPKLEIDPERVAYVPQLLAPRLHLPLVLREVLELYANRRIDAAAIRDFGLLEPRHLKLSWNTASGGERMRTLVMAALLRAPEVLVLDEPLNHLDAASRDGLRRAIRTHLLARETRSLLLVSHEDLDLSFSAGRALHQLTLKGAGA